MRLIYSTTSKRAIFDVVKYISYADPHLAWLAGNDNSIDFSHKAEQKLSERKTLPKSLHKSKSGLFQLAAPCHPNENENDKFNCVSSRWAC